MLYNSRKFTENFAVSVIITTFAMLKHNKQTLLTIKKLRL